MDIFNGNQAQIGQIVRNGDREEAYDQHGTYLGYSNSDGTYDYRGNRVASPGNLGLLINR